MLEHTNIAGNRNPYNDDNSNNDVIVMLMIILMIIIIPIKKNTLANIISYIWAYDLTLFDIVYDISKTRLVIRDTLNANEVIVIVLVIVLITVIIIEIVLLW